MKDDNSVEELMLDLIYGGHAGWAAAEFNLVEAGLIEMIHGHQPGLMRESDNGWIDLRWTLTDLGRLTREARFEQVMKADPPPWAAEQDAEEEAQDYQQTFADGDPDDYWAAIHRHMSIRLDIRAERIHQKVKRRAGTDGMTCTTSPSPGCEADFLRGRRRSRAQVSRRMSDRNVLPRP
jgi:hypothetical protein